MQGKEDKNYDTGSRAKSLAKSRKLGKGSELGWVNAVKTLPCGYSFIGSCMPKNARGERTLKQGHAMTRSVIFQIQCGIEGYKANTKL